MNYNPRDFIYDIETFKNLFTNCIYHPYSGQWWMFEISPWCNDWLAMSHFMNDCRRYGSRWIGFNNLGFDYPVVHNIIKRQITDVGLIYQESQRIINGGRFENQVWDNDQICQQVDLYKIHHFDNNARATSLKMLQFNMCLQNIQELPYHHATELDSHQRQVVIDYNYHDVDSTFKFYLESLDKIKFREQLTERHGFNFINHNDTKIGKDIFIHKLEDAQRGICWDYSSGKRKPRQTYRSLMYVDEIILPYVSFDHPNFKLTLDWLRTQTLVKTKGAFEYLKMSPEMAMIMNPDRLKVHGLKIEDVPSLPQNKTTQNQLRKGMLFSKCMSDLVQTGLRDGLEFISGWKDESGLNCIVEGFRYDFGTGGIHGSIDSAIVVTDDVKVIIDLDVASYYPNLAIANKLFPEHLAELFCEIYESMYIDRKNIKGGMKQIDNYIKQLEAAKQDYSEQQIEYKILDDMQESLKLALNGTYGDSNSTYSPLYDPQFTMSITINGQLLLCMLADQLIKIPELEMIQINTDGLTVRCPHQHVDHLRKVCQWWETLTNLELEENIYSRMFIRDVNNYIAEYQDGKLKRKGAYEYELGWHQNHSQKVVAKAAEAYLVRGIPIEQFIRSHTNLHDFMLRTKVPRDSELLLDGVKLQNITRYYMSTNGGKEFIKFSPPKGELGAYKRKNGLTDAQYNAVVEELRQKHPHGALPWDERINNKSKTVYENRSMAIQGSAGWLVKECNDISKASFNDIDYEYYIAETRKLTDSLTYCK